MIGGGKGLGGGEYDERDREGGDRKQEAEGQNGGETWEGGGGCVEVSEDKVSVEEEEEGGGDELAQQSPYPAVLEDVFKRHHDSDLRLETSERGFCRLS